MATLIQGNRRQRCVAELLWSLYWYATDEQVNAVYQYLQSTGAGHPLTTLPNQSDYEELVADIKDSLLASVDAVEERIVVKSLYVTQMLQGHEPA